MNITRAEVLEIACKYCEFRGEGDYTPKHFPTGDAVMSFVRECIELNGLVSAALATTTAPEGAKND